MFTGDDSKTSLNRPIGVFDSGIGGLTVLKGLISELPNENWIYLGDTARLPYGSKSPETIKNYTRQNLKFMSQFNCKAFIIACNSASAQFNENYFQRTPVFNVIDPGVTAALSLGIKNKIGIIGTKATIQSQIYTQKLKAAGYQGEILVKACPLLVPLVEEGLFQDAITDLVIEKYLMEFKLNRIDSLILGCTHYPLLKKAIQQFFSYPLNLISSELFLGQMIKKKKLNQTLALENNRGFIKIMTTDDYKNVEALATTILDSNSLIFETVELFPRP